MTKTFLQIGSLFALLAVVLGAFGAHGLETQLSPERLDTFETGVRYHFYHSFALLATALIGQHFSHKLIRTAGWLFAVGILLFSGSIYLLACRDILGIASWTWLGPITPIGGTFFIVGWALLMVGIGQARA